MGCNESKPTEDDCRLEARKALINFGAYGDFQYVVETVKKIRKPKPWMHPESITRAQLAKIRDEFWDTAPYYGGRKEIWDALRAAAEAELILAQAIIDSAGVIVQNDDLTISYGERGANS